MMDVLWSYSGVVETNDPFLGFKGFSICFY